MKTFVLILLFVLLGAWTHGGSVSSGINYYISSSGNDASDGLTPATAWASPNHAVNCGDTLSAAAGTYSNVNFASTKWGTVSNCPSANGIYFAQVQCAGPFVTSCSISASSNEGMWISKSNWAVIGWIVASTGTSCFTAAPTSAANIHHIAYVNVIANGCNSNGINSFQYSGNSDFGVDYFAIAGAITYNAAQGTNLCFSGVSVYEPALWNSLSGTHIYIAGVFTIANIDGTNCQSGANSDGNGIIFDDWSHSQQGSHVAYAGQGVIEQSMALGNGASGFFSFNNTAGQVYIFSSTTYGNYASSIHNGTFNGELLFSGNTATTVAQGNIFQASHQTTNGNNVYAAFVGNGNGNNTISGNYIFGVAGNNTQINTSPGFSFGTNTLATPNFVNPIVPGAPSCSPATTTTACMSATIANFVAQAGGAAGLGYQSPTACAPNSYFPIWLKGIVPNGIITKPCGM